LFYYSTLALYDIYPNRGGPTNMMLQSILQTQGLLRSVG